MKTQWLGTRIDGGCQRPDGGLEVHRITRHFRFLPLDAYAGRCSGACAVGSGRPSARSRVGRWARSGSSELLDGGSQVALAPESGTVAWPGDIDLAPDALYKDISSVATP